MIEPVTLYDDTTITNGQSAILDVRKMTAPGNRPMLVKDVIFTIYGTTVQSNFLAHWGALVRARIRAGRFDVSNAPIPVWLYGTVPDALGESVDAYQSPLSADGDYRHFARYRWVLPQPMYLPPGAAFQTTFFRDDSVGTWARSFPTTLTVQISVRGLLLDERMKVSKIPFVGAFVPVSGQIRSREDDLKNTLDKPWHAHRLAGRIAVSGELTPGDFYTSLYDGLLPLKASAASARAYRYQMKLDDNSGQAITNGLVPMCSIFPAQGRNWTFVRKMEVGDQLRVTLDRVPTTAAWPMVALIGSRDEVV
jgi:hypothetical protein